MLKEDILIHHPWGCQFLFLFLEISRRNSVKYHMTFLFLFPVPKNVCRDTSSPFCLWFSGWAATWFLSSYRPSVQPITSFTQVKCLWLCSVLTLYESYRCGLMFFFFFCYWSIKIGRVATVADGDLNNRRNKQHPDRQN